ncbi:hypothetical protein Pyn_21854 [Prunus yedoensis var. nudiflora]|uniref:Uncharacterized protein n=1 Tax=Prunus yedoensis var. nudiflora TaxID=2094558 RepID=A0A314UEW0_PRUYE|nr:hypothetical protein Pyn_21854 [Prunus yedoensis var. nudiflora]
MAKFDAGKKMVMPTGSKSGILHCVPISLGLSNAFAGSLFPYHVLKLPAALHTWTPPLLFIAFVFTQVLRLLLTFMLIVWASWDNNMTCQINGLSLSSIGPSWLW